MLSDVDKHCIGGSSIDTIRVKHYTTVISGVRIVGVSSGRYNTIVRDDKGNLVLDIMRDT